MRTIKIDFSSGNPKIECDSSAAGIQGEHRASELVIIPPPDMPSGLSYRLAFDPGGQSDTLSLTDGELRYELPQSITRHDAVSMTVEGYEGEERIYKSVMVELYFDAAVDTDNPVDVDGHNIGAEVAANTLARHSHDNKDVLDMLSDVDGKLQYAGSDVGLKGDKGEKGDTGAAFTYSDFTAEQLAALKGEKGAKGDKGDKGDTGAQGAQGIQGEKGEKGDTGATGAAGKDGADGKDGAPGADGTSATHSWNGTVLNITSASGTSSADLKGEKGDKGDKGDTGAQGVQGTQGPKGDKGDKGDTGPAGANGYTPVKGTDYFTEADKTELVAMVIESLGGNPVFGYVDENNNIIVSGNLADGTYFVKYEMEDGSTVDIGDLVLDTNVYYTVTNTLTNCTNSNSATQAVQGGSYSATITANSGYELSSVVVTMGGTDISSTAVSGGKITIANVTGNIVITVTATETVVVPSYTNLLPLAVDTDGNPYVGANGEDGYKAGYKISTNSGNESAVNGAYCSGFIPISDIYDIVRIKNITLSSSASINNIVFYNSKKEKLYGVAGTANAFNNFFQVANGVYSVQASHWLSATDGSDISFFRFSCGGITDGTIVTVNEEI